MTTSIPLWYNTSIMIELNVYEATTNEHHWDEDVNTVPKVGDKLQGCTITHVEMVNNDNMWYTVWVRY